MDAQSLIEKQMKPAAALRQRLHQIPELAFEEIKTAAAIRAELDALGISYVAGVPGASTATIAWIGDIKKPCIALRSDIDALPIVEKTNLPYASTHTGRMHACGHDGHIATLLGVATILKSIENQLSVCVKFMWQPAEEAGGGAEKLVDAGALDGRIGPKVSAVFGLHGWPGLKVGMVASKAGPLLAATDNFIATFIGKGSHGAYPHRGVDPIVAAAEAVLSVQMFASREYDPTDATVVTIGKFNAGTAVNIIPDTATIEATVRTLTREGRELATKALERRMRGVALANNCDLNFRWVEGYPSTINDPGMYDYVAKIAKQTFGPTHFLPVAKPSMGGEDFAYYLQQVPGCFFLIGVEPHDRDSYPALHNDHYDFTDAALATGMRMFVELVLNWGK
ncbi:MAG TPA: M20 family metallopeptidase [Tepidisphaeraceae bacterium]|nr:M20 family metallopeptidase [Tepidisphaeraceae bacterium]